MVKVTYIEAIGAEHVVDIRAGFSVMEGAVQNDIPGILADCGGSCACATCRVYVDETWRERTGMPSDMEKSMLDCQDDSDSSVRLACQIRITEALDGLIVRMPQSQL
ncbi:MAG: 2Fe-2S iron-sulfur cluster binding domain-containing protein [Rhodospirillaceae bacterium]|nr:MAG: 2Fe-2S iron-sulfur cluster binding domain-containing protein [Rhodospirillaceae bacterium]